MDIYSQYQILNSLNLLPQASVHVFMDRKIKTLVRLYQKGLRWATKQIIFWYIVIRNLIGNPNAIAERFKISFAEHVVVPACAYRVDTSFLRMFRHFANQL